MRSRTTMRSMRYDWAISAGCLFSGILLGASPAEAEDFRVVNRIFLEQQTTPVVVTTTLFQDGIAYDYVAGQPNVAILDGRRGRFVLLDTRRKLRTEIVTDDMDRLIQEIRGGAGSSSKPAVVAAAVDRLEVRAGDGPNELVLVSEPVEYRLKTIPAASAEMARQVHAFSDAYAKLNALGSSGTSPFARLAVNRELAARQRLAVDVRRIDRPAKGPVRTVRSEHQFDRQLLPADLDRIATTASQLASFQPIRFGEFLKKQK